VSMSGIWDYANRSALVGVVSYLLVAVMLGVILAAVVDSREDARTVDTQLLERIERLELEGADARRDHREANQRDHDDICRLIYEVVQASPTLRDRGIEPCESRPEDHWHND
jgi:hypothetical protein